MTVEPAVDIAAPPAPRPKRLPFAVAAGLLFLLWTANGVALLSDPVAIAACVAVPVGLLAFGLRAGLFDRVASSRLARLGLPIVAAMVSQNMVNLVDTYFVGQLPENVSLPGLAALGAALPLFWLVGGFLSAIAVGTQAITARRHGEGNDESAGQTLGTAATLTVILGVAFSALGYVFIPYVLPLVNDNTAVVAQGISFGQVRFLGVASMVITAAYKAFFDGTGKTYVHMIAAILMNVVNVILCYGLIEGNLGMPRLEVAGAAWASAVSSAIGTLVMIAWSFRPTVLRQYRIYRSGAFSWSTARSIVQLSLPSGAAEVVGMVGFLLFMKAVAAVDKASGSAVPVNASATTVILQIVLFLFLIAFAFGTATASLVSQSLGARDAGAASRFTWESVKLTTLLMAIAGSLLFVFPEEVMGFFLTNKLDAGGKELVVAASVTPIRLIACATTVLGAGVVFVQSLYGAGNTRYVAIVVVLLQFGCLVPLAWLFGVVLDAGLVGIVGAAALYFVLLTLAVGWKFAEGSWKHINL